MGKRENKLFYWKFELSLVMLCSEGYRLLNGSYSDSSHPCNNNNDNITLFV